jgi:hypothetical protein
MRPNAATAIVADRPSAPEAMAVRPAQAARLLSMSERTIWTLIGTGRLAVSRVGNITLIHMSSIRALLGEPSPIHTP